MCPVSVYQPSTEVEAGLLGYLQEHAMTEEAVEAVLSEIQQEIAREFANREIDTDALESELKQLRVVQRRLARAIAAIDDPGLLSELQQRRTRSTYIETQLAAAQRSPEVIAEQMSKVETTACTRCARQK